MIRRVHALPRGFAVFALLAVLSALLLAGPLSARAGGGPAAGAVAGVDARTLFDRPHVMGASASFGFGVRAPFPSDHPGRLQHVTLARIAQAARLQPGAVSSDATTLFFTSPIDIGKRQVDLAVGMEPKPTIVLAVDYLFWFTYGARDAERTPIRKEEQRMAMLERGLANLDRIVQAGVPVVVGDLPNMKGAVGKMLSAQQMPQDATLVSANERIKTWAASRPLVAIVPLAALVTELDSDKPFKAGNRTWSSKDDGPLIQSDRLHPTFAGTVALLARAEQTAQEHFSGATTAFEHDPAKVAIKIRAEVEAEIAARDAAKAKAGDKPKASDEKSSSAR